MQARKETRSLRRNGFDIDIYGTAYGGIMWHFVLSFTVYSLHIGVKKKRKEGDTKKNINEMR